MEYKCNICNKLYKSYQSLWNHNRKFHTINDFKMTSVDFVMTSNDFEKLQNENQIICKYCDKKFTRNNNLNYHIKNICKVKKQKELEESIYKMELEKLKLEIEKLKKNPKKIINNYNAPVNNGLINNNSNNNSNNKTLNLCQPGKENINLLTDTEKKYILSQGMNSIVSLVEQLNFNDRLPQNHNFYTSAINDKHVNTIDLKTNSFIKQSKKDLFDQILNSHIQKLETLGQNNKKFNDVFNNIKAFIYLRKGKKEFMNQVNMLSYNKRNMIINTWNKLIDDSSILPEDIPDKFESQVKQIVAMSEEECMSETNYISSEEGSSEYEISYDESDEEQHQLIFKNRKVKNKKNIIV